MKVLGWILSSIVAFLVMVKIATSISPEDASPGIGIIIFLMVVIGTVVMARTLFYGTSKTKDTIKEKSKEYVERKRKQKSIEEKIKRYESSKHRFQYVSDDMLQDKYGDMKKESIENMERLALEEEMVERGILDHSEMHEKLSNIVKNIKNS